MMESTPADRWKACLDYIREHIPPTEYTRWFEPLALAECRDGRVVVSIPTKYVGEYIRENHRQVVAEALALTQSATDLEEVRSAYLTVNRDVQENVPMISCYIVSKLGVVSNRLLNAAPDVFGTFVNVHEWDVQ